MILFSWIKKNPNPPGRPIRGLLVVDIRQPIYFPRLIQEQLALRILGDQAERERLGARGREIATARFTAERIIPQYEELYRRVIGECATKYDRP